MTPPLRPPPWLPLPTILTRTFRTPIAIVVDDGSRWLVLFLSALRMDLIRGYALCGRGEVDHDEGLEDVPPRSRDGTRHAAGLSGLMHAPLTD